VTKMLTANDVATHLAGLARDLSRLVDALAVQEREAVNKREDYTLALSKAFLMAEGPMDIRKHQSIVDTHAQRIAAEAAEALVRGLRRQIDTVEIRIDVGRSMGVAIRSELNLSNLDAA